jgi:beta-fructofuranosidase
VLEVFVNGRTVVTTRVYPESGKCFGVMPWVVGKEKEGTRIKKFEVWELRGKS